LLYVSSFSFALTPCVARTIEMVSPHYFHRLLQ